MLLTLYGNFGRFKSRLYSIGYKVLGWRFQIILELPMKFIKESTFFTKLNYNMNWGFVLPYLKQVMFSM
jgi:hypothetical protein